MIRDIVRMYQAWSQSDQLGPQKGFIESMEAVGYRREDLIEACKMYDIPVDTSSKDVNIKT